MYHFFKKKYLNEGLQEMSCLDLNCLTLEGKFYLISQEQEGLFRLENNLRYSLNNKVSDKDFIKNFNENEENHLFHCFYNHERNRKFRNHKGFYMKSYYYNKNRVSSLCLLFKIKNSYLKNIYSLLIINLPTIFNESTRGGKLSISKTSLNYFYENYLHLKFKIKSILNSKLNFSRKSE